MIVEAKKVELRECDRCGEVVLQKLLVAEVDGVEREVWIPAKRHRHNGKWCPYNGTRHD